MIQTFGQYLSKGDPVRYEEAHGHVEANLGGTCTTGLRTLNKILPPPPPS